MGLGPGRMPGGSGVAGAACAGVFAAGDVSGAQRGADGGDVGVAVLHLGRERPVCPRFSFPVFPSPVFPRYRARAARGGGIKWPPAMMPIDRSESLAVAKARLRAEIQKRKYGLSHPAKRNCSYCGTKIIPREATFHAMGACVNDKASEEYWRKVGRADVPRKSGKAVTDLAGRLNGDGLMPRIVPGGRPESKR